MGPTRQADRPLARWYLVALGVVIGFGIAAVALAAIVNPSTDLRIEVAVGVIPLVVAALVAVVTANKRRRKRRL